jgi:phosphatidylglycerol:prolipoprotein diacylglycerol transferase
MELLVLPYPVIDPVAIEFGPVAVRWYGLAYMAGILLGWLYGRRLVSRADLWKQAAADEHKRRLSPLDHARHRGRRQARLRAVL